MSTFVRARASSASAPVAVILPGAGYTAMGPLLYWCGEMLSQEGWHVQGVEWKVDARALSDPQAFVEQAVAEAFDAAPPSSRRLIVAKSLGCFALPWARANGIPGVWLTPVLANEDVRLALAEASAADMAVGGDADAVCVANSCVTHQRRHPLRAARLIPGSFMTGSRVWLSIGLIIAIVGIILIVLGLRRPGRGRTSR